MDATLVSVSVIDGQKFIQIIESIIHKKPYTLDFFKSDTFLPRTSELKGEPRTIQKRGLSKEDGRKTHTSQVRWRVYQRVLAS